MVINRRSHRMRPRDVSPVVVDVRLQHRRRADPQRHHPDPLLRRQLVGGWLERRHPDGWMGFLVWLGHHLPRRDLPEPALPLERLRLPDLGNHRQRLFPHIPRVPGINPHAGLLVGRRPSCAEIHPAVGKVVHHRDPLRHPHRVMIGQDHHAEPQPDPLGQPAQRSENNLGTGRRRKRGQEVVLHEPNVIEAHLVRQDALFNRLFQHRMVIQGRPLHLISQPKLHN